MSSAILAVILAFVPIQTYLASHEDYKYIDATNLNWEVTGKYIKDCIFPRYENKIILYEQFYRHMGDLGSSEFDEEGNWPFNYTTNKPVLKCANYIRTPEMLQPLENTYSIDMYDLGKMVEECKRINNTATSLVSLVTHLDVPVAKEIGINNINWKFLNEKKLATQVLEEILDHPRRSIFRPEIFTLDTSFWANQRQVADWIFDDLQSYQKHIRETWYLLSHTDFQQYSHHKSFRSIDGDDETTQTNILLNTYFAGDQMMHASYNLSKYHQEYVIPLTKWDEESKSWVFDRFQIDRRKTVEVDDIPLTVDVILDSSLCYYSDYINYKKPWKNYHGFCCGKISGDEFHISRDPQKIHDELWNSINTNFVFSVELNNITPVTQDTYLKHSNYCHSVKAQIEINKTKINEMINALLQQKNSWNDEYEDLYFSTHSDPEWQNSSSSSISLVLSIDSVIIVSELEGDGK